MPSKPKRICPRPGCPGMWDGKTCTKCGGKPKQDRRESAAKRGYGRGWQRYRRRFLRLHPLCAKCKAHGRVSEATVIHHIEEAVNADDESFFDPENHMALCRDCHEATHGRKKKYGWE